MSRHYARDVPFVTSSLTGDSCPAHVSDAMHGTVDGVHAGRRLVLQYGVLQTPAELMASFRAQFTAPVIGPGERT